MPRKDYEQFLGLWKEQLDSRYYVHCNDTDPSYWLPFAKIRKHNTVFDEVDVVHLDVPKGIFVDIFPLDCADKQGNPFQWIRAGVVRTLGAIILSRKGLFLSRKTRRDVTSMRTLLKPLLKILVVTASRAFSMHALSKLQQRVMSWNRNDHAPCYASFGTVIAGSNKPFLRICTCLQPRSNSREKCSVLHETGITY
jgi:hypothetical protein